MSEYCAICGKPAECEHHLVFGRSQRKLATKHHLTMKMCNSCHNMAEKATERLARLRGVTRSNIYKIVQNRENGVRGKYVKVRIDE